MSSTRVRLTRPFFAQSVALLIAAVSLPVLVASAASAEPGSGSSQDDPIILTSLSDLPPGAVVLGSQVTQCATATTYSLTVPAVAETTREEFRWPLDVRTYKPAVAEVKEYTYKRPVTKTEYRFKYQKQVAGKIQKSANGSWYDTSTFGFEWWQRPTWNTDGSFKWGAWDGTAEVIETGSHGSTSNSYTSGGSTYRKVSTSYRYAKTTTSESRTVDGGFEYRDWTTEILGAPWIKTGERIKTAGQPAAFTPWAFEAWTAWSPSSAAPVDPDGQGGETNPLNLRRVGTPMETRVLGNGDAQPAKVTYYRYSDAKVCETVVPNPTPAPEPTSTPEVEVLGEQSGRATGRLRTSCQGTVRVTMKNTTSSTAVYKIKVGREVTRKKVAAESKKSWTTRGKHRSVAKLMLGRRVLDKERLPKACPRPEVLPETGKRR